MSRLGQETGGDEPSRVNEARVIVRMLEEFTEELTPRELAFVEQMSDCYYCTGKQLFWLRDIKDKYL